MCNLMSFAPVLSALVSVGDSTDLTVPALIAAIGVAALAAALYARRRGKDDDASGGTRPSERKHPK